MIQILLRSVGIAVIALIALAVLKNLSDGLSSLVRVGAVLLLFGIVIFELADTVGALKDIFSSVGTHEPAVAEMIGVMLKALGIALISRLCADVCRECGENGIAQGVETVAGVLILSLSLPIITEILKFAVKILERTS